MEWITEALGRRLRLKWEGLVFDPGHGVHCSPGWRDQVGGLEESFARVNKLSGFTPRIAKTRGF